MVSQEMTIAWCRSITPCAWDSKLWKAREPTWYALPQLYRPCRSYPFWTAAGSDTTLNVDAGGNWPWVARDTSGVPAFLLLSRSSSLVVIPPSHTLGSYVG